MYLLEHVQVKTWKIINKQQISSDLCREINCTLQETRKTEIVIENMHRYQFLMEKILVQQARRQFISIADA